MPSQHFTEGNFRLRILYRKKTMTIDFYSLRKTLNKPLLRLYFIKSPLQLLKAPLHNLPWKPCPFPSCHSNTAGPAPHFQPWEVSGSQTPQKARILLSIPPWHPIQIVFSVVMFYTLYHLGQALYSLFQDSDCFPSPSPLSSL